MAAGARAVGAGARGLSVAVNVLVSWDPAHMGPPTPITDSLIFSSPPVGARFTAGAADASGTMNIQFTTAGNLDFTHVDL